MPVFFAMCFGTQQVCVVKVHRDAFRHLCFFFAVITSRVEIKMLHWIVKCFGPMQLGSLALVQMSCFIYLFFILAAVIIFEQGIYAVG